MNDMSRLAAPSAAFLDGLRELLGPKGAQDPEPEDPRLSEPRDRWRGSAAMIVRPASTEETAEVVRRCAEAGVAITPYSGGTGLVGGQLRPETPGGAPGLLLSTDRMNRVRLSAPEDDAVVVEAGVTLSGAQEAAEKAGRLFPLSIASEGTARIGGVLSTNAGGLAVLRYGMARDLVLGVEAVLPDGSIHHGLKLLRKNNTGYDLRHLLIGAEGTLGVITAAALRLYPRPAEWATAFCAVPSPDAALELLHLVRERMGETVSAFELIHKTGIDFLAEHVPDARHPLDPVPEWSVLTEAASGAGSEMQARLEAALEAGFEAGLIEDAAVAQSEAQRAAFWQVRESIPEANRKVGAVSNHDVSAPMSKVADFIRAAGPAIEAAAPGTRINCFGHLGDGNLHYNVYPAPGRPKEDYDNLRPEIKRIVHDLIDAHGGSFSAEHGIGRLKVGELARYGDPAKLAAMRAIKAALDPRGIMNPGALFG